MAVNKCSWEKAGQVNARYVEFEKVQSLPNIRKHRKCKTDKERGNVVKKFTNLKIESYVYHMFSPVKTISID